MKTNHKERKQKEGVLFQRDLQPQRMNLTEGDVVYVYKPAPLGEREDGPVSYTHLTLPTIA